MAVVKNAIKAMEKKMSPEAVAQARREAQHEIFQIKLSDLRKRMGIRQTDIQSFSQASISKLEQRKDIKLSTLVEYLASLGLGVEIKVYPKRRKSGILEEITLLKA
jgi:hypothetical protein